MRSQLTFVLSAAWFLLTTLLLLPVHAETAVAVTDGAYAVGDSRNFYARDLLKEVLRRTENQFGPIDLRPSAYHMNLERMRRELVLGKLINVTAQVTQIRWESELIAIPIPIDLGLSSWRVALIRREDQDRFGNVHDIDLLRRLPGGVGKTWAIAKPLGSNGFNLVEGSSYEGLFSMLARHRFDYILRGVNEAFAELDSHAATYPDIAIDGRLLLFVPLPRFYFVSPQYPKLAERIHLGLKHMLRDGSLRRMMLNYHAMEIKQVDFCSRRLFRIENMDLTPQTQALLNDKDLWFDPFNKMNGICSKSG